jgi:uncharacterized protein YutE (UPF0331/DUF86 family)
MKERIDKEIVRRTKEEIKQPLYQITDKFAKPAISLYLIQNDIEEIANCITKAEGYIDKDELLVSSLWKNAVVTYGKIFAKSDDGFTSLEKSDCISEKYLEIHNKLIALRNSFIAHRGENEVENSMLLTYEKRENGFISFEYTIPTAMKIGHLINDIELVKSLISELKTKVENKLNKKLKGIDTLLWKELEKAGKIKPKQ